MLTNLFTIFCGLALLLGGGTLLIPGTIGLARRFNIPARIVAFVIVAGGTSAPELLVSVNAVLQDSPGIAWGNVLGSNLFNLLIALGGAGLFGSLVIDIKLVLLPMMLVVLVSVMLLILSYREKPISARLGFVFIGFYLCFLGLESMMSAA